MPLTLEQRRESSRLAGCKGGRTTANRYGHEYFVQLGRLGAQHARRQRAELMQEGEKAIERLANILGKES